MHIGDREKILAALHDIERIGIAYIDVRETHLVISAHGGEVKFTHLRRLVSQDMLGYSESDWYLLLQRHHVSLRLDRISRYPRLTIGSPAEMSRD